MARKKKKKAQARGPQTFEQRRARRARAKTVVESRQRQITATIGEILADEETIAQNPGRRKALSARLARNRRLLTTLRRQKKAAERFD